MTAPDPRALRHAFGAFMTGVTVVTAMDADGAPLGFTANSFTSVSLDPPLVLVCLAKSSQNFDALTNAAGFAVNVLAESQIAISNTFARPVDDRFIDVEWHMGEIGSPILRGVSAWFDCHMHNIVDAGDHVIMIGRVGAFDTSTRPGLGYARGAYVTPTKTAEVLEEQSNLFVSALIERDGCVLLEADDSGKLALPEAMVVDAGVSGTLRALLRQTDAHARPGFVYSVFDDVDQSQHHITFLCQTAATDPIRGSFVPLDDLDADRVASQAVWTMLERFGAERQIGTFGLYYGTETQGDVRPMTTES